MFHYLFAPFKWIFSAPARWLGGARGWFGWSLPTRVAFILFLFLIFCVIGYYIASAFSSGATFSPKKDPAFIFALVLLVFAIPAACYFAVKAWLESEPSQFPDIDEAWEKGWTAVRRAGIDPSETPLFFAMGVSTARQADQLMQATDWELLVQGEPDGRAPLRWYARQEGIVVVLLNACATSKIQSASEAIPVARGGGANALRGTLVGAPGAGPQTDVANLGIRGTIVAGANQEPAAVPMAAAPTGLRGTMVTSDSTATQMVANAIAPPQLAPADRKDLAEQSERLRRVCKLAAQARQPLCPINGTIAIIDWNQLLQSQPGRLSGPLRDDARIIIEGSQLHAPMAVLITGLDDELGFIELVRRVGENRARENRFGHGYNHLAPTTPDQLVLLAQHACGAFEDWIYDLFRHPDCLGRSHNDKLFALLCKIRNRAQPKVAELLSSLAGVAEGNDQRGPLLCGCYFAAAGSSRLRQAFVRSVFDKLFELEEDLEWSSEAWQRENTYLNIARGFIAINALLFVFILGLLFYSYVWKQA